jgi:hypothetical protein
MVIAAKTEWVRLGTVKLPRSIPNLAPNPNNFYFKGLDKGGGRTPNKNSSKSA